MSREPTDPKSHLRQSYRGQICVRQEAEIGGQGRNRTSDTRIFSAVLYQLSYLADL